MKNIIIIIITTLLFSSCNEEKKIKRKIVKSKSSPVYIPKDSVKYNKASLVIKGECFPYARNRRNLFFRVKVLNIIKSSSDIKMNDTIEVAYKYMNIHPNDTTCICVRKNTVGIIYLTRGFYEHSAWDVVSNLIHKKIRVM